MAVNVSAPAAMTPSERGTIFPSRTRASMTCRSVAASFSVLARSSSAASPVGASKKAASSALIPAAAVLTASARCFLAADVASGFIVETTSFFWSP